MKKTRFNGKAHHSVAVSQDTGCVVMLRIEADDTLKVMGSLTREQSLKLAEDVTKWVGSIEGAVQKAVALQ